MFVIDELWCFSRSDKNVNRDSFVKCILKGEELYGIPSKTIFISLPISEQDTDDSSAVVSHSMLINDISDYKKWLLIIANVTKGNIINPKVRRANTIHNYIIYFRHSGEFRKSIDLLNEQKVLNPHANFLIVTTTHFESDHPIIIEIFQVLEEFQILKSVLLIGDPKDQSNFNLFGFIQFRNDTCKNNARKDIKLIDTCRQGNYTSNTKWYDFNVPRLFKSCTLKVVYAEVPPYVVNMKQKDVLSSDEFTSHGLEIGIVTNIFAYMNISLRFIKSDIIGDIDSDKRSTGSLRILLNKEADLAIGVYGLTLARMTFFDNSFPYIFENLVWVVPHEHLPLGELLLGLASIIHYDVWIVIALLGVTTGSLIIFISNHTSDETIAFKRPSRAVQNLLTIMLNITVGSLPKSHALRMIFSMVLVFAITYNAAYTTYLTSVLAKADRYREKYDDVSDIEEHNLSIYIAPNARNFFQISSTIHYKLVHRGTRCILADFDKCLNDVAMHRNASFLAQHGFVKYVRDNYLSASHTRLLKILPDPVLSYQVNFFMVKGFWGLERVNSLLNNAVASGLAEKWMYTPKNHNSANVTDIAENERVAEGTTTLTFKNLVFVFYLMLAGHAIATIAFIAEVLIHKYYDDNIRIPSGKLDLLTWPEHTLYQ
ncbi:unnamed protein product [Ceutorhynchus assimilis]|uniref:Ionotropic glutamate receptor C-terminal domain-containing protein n=1 Tax=Ceutorhynchus assimilis TaxID=467358 RepID=A0A9N9QKA6_9CUCU|nr:unnamed protein product [Ceutorhynchus assimilis]